MKLFRRHSIDSKKLISEAADVIERDGLAYRDLGNVNGPKCILGALIHVLMGSPRAFVPGGPRYSALASAIDLLEQKSGTNGIHAALYSDTHSKDTVVATMRKVAK